MTKPPEFIVCLDLCAGTGTAGWFIKAMKETDLLDALAKIEKSIRERPGQVYTASLLQKTKQKAKGKHLYQVVLMSRPPSDEYRPFCWHRRIEGNNEHEWGMATWIPTDSERHGYLEFVDGTHLGLY